MTKKLPIILLCLSCCIIFINATKKPLPGCDAPLVGGHTGAPGETACNGCHAGTLNSGPATFTFDLGTTTYAAGQTYTGTVRISQGTMPKFGFSCLALKDSNNTTIGAFNLLETVRTRTYNDGPRKYVSHTPCGADSANANSWRFAWTAPVSNVGNITLYIGLLAANHSHSTSGDFSYTSSKLLAYQPLAGIKEESLGFNYSVYPNPSAGEIQIDLDAKSSDKGVEISIINAYGQEVYNQHAFANTKIKTSEWPKGFYTVKLKKGAVVSSKKLIIE